MKSLRFSAGLVAMALVTAAPNQADAAWNNVFQVTCWNCKPRTSASYYVAPGPVASYYVAPAPVVAYSAPAASCNPCQQCTTNYVQRCYYQPVTTYQTQSYYEAVTTYTTKTYYEPVTTYRYSSYYDPCSCSCQQVATPCTSYVARQQCCPVQSWVQRCCQVPVTAYQKAFYWEPQTSCYTPAPTCCTPTSGGPIAAPPAMATQPPPVMTQPPPAVDGRSTPPPPTVDGKSSGGNPTYNEYYQKDQPQSQYRQLPPNGQVQAPAKSSPSVPPPSVKLERIASSDGTVINGQVVNDANSPKAGARLIFVSAQRQAPEKSATANGAGHFQVELAQGGWLVYLRGTDGQQAYHSRIDVAAKQTTPIVLVSR
jgi:hypothetical protein